MRSIILDGEQYTLDDECVWHGGDKNVRSILNSLSKIKLLDYSVACGFRDAFVFYYIVEELEPTEVVDDTPPKHSEPGVCY